MRRVLLLALAGVLGLAAPARGQTATTAETFSLDRYQAPPSIEDGLSLQLPRTLGPWRVSAQLLFDYAHRPLVLEGPAAEIGAVVENRLRAHVLAAIGLGSRFQVHIGLPIVLTQNGMSVTSGGMSYPEPSGTAVGDMAIGGSVRMVGKDEGLFQLGLTVSLFVPTGSADALAGEGTVGVRGALLAAVNAGPVTLAAALGASYRPEKTYGMGGGAAQVGSALDFGAGLHVRVARGLRLMADFAGSTTFSDLSLKGAPLEVLAGLRYTAPFGLSVGAGAGPGLSNAAGTPDARALLTIGWAPPRKQKPTGPADRDHDLIVDTEDRCPDEPGPRENAGCPDTDKDGDSVVDRLDQCPDQSGPAENQGCPWPDTDQDGILDKDDKCPREPEDKDSFQDEDGCPDLDNDGDGIADKDDKCPGQAETVNQYQDEDGCPDTVRISGSRIIIPDPIQFELNSDVIKSESEPTLEQVARILREHPEVKKMSLEGHASAEGTPAHNLELSQRRAASVLRWLVSHGVEEARLTSSGFGVARPLVKGNSEAARRKNRRVEFKITQQEAAGGAQPAVEQPRTVPVPPRQP